MSETPQLGRVMAAQANYYFVQTATTSLLCTCRSRLKKIGAKVLVGDRVLVLEPPAGDGRGAIVEILPRDNQLSRPAIANIDQILLVFALAEPPLDPWQLSRFLVKGESTGLKLQLCLNKSDLASLSQQQQWQQRLEDWGYHPIFLSVLEQQGLENLHQQLHNHTSIIAGPSGVGKSTLINSLIPAVEQRVGSVSGKLQHGRHTTRHIELFSLPAGGLIADSPGFNQPELTLEPSQIANCFPEIRQILKTQTCQFHNCLHRDEPNCVVRGTWERYEHYLKILEEVSEESLERQKRPEQETGLKLKVKSAGEHHYEPKLASKKYRRSSRREKQQNLQEQYHHQTLAEIEQNHTEELD